ncbi:hypothetical protein [Leucobacter japonicus]|uniref:hypothetical protein n=1 Tax=Leucobacter japonicus TaxID=1461259 RepID=UPI00138F423B|nr:hypothetical protein [Leucobacter japonicus]
MAHNPFEFIAFCAHVLTRSQSPVKRMSHFAPALSELGSIFLATMPTITVTHRPITAAFCRAGEIALCGTTPAISPA